VKVHFGDAWDVRSVVQKTMKDDITEVIQAQMASANPGSESYITRYQKACSDLIESFSPEKLAECEAQAEEWNTTGPDRATKAQ